MANFVYDEYHHITGFEFLFPDGKFKSAFLLTSVSQLSGHQVVPDHLRQFRFREGVDFLVVNASDLPHTLLSQESMRGRRTILSLSGLMRLVLRGTSDFSVKVQEWVVDVVIPGELQNGHYRRPEIDALFDRFLRGDGGATLGDLIGFDL
jgi:hypothetical protein